MYASSEAYGRSTQNAIRDTRSRRSGTKYGPRGFVMSESEGHGDGRTAASRRLVLCEDFVVDAGFAVCRARALAHREPRWIRTVAIDGADSLGVWRGVIEQRPGSIMRGKSWESMGVK
jgi:hypothetical protein